MTTGTGKASPQSPERPLKENRWKRAARRTLQTLFPWAGMTATCRYCGGKLETTREVTFLSGPYVYAGAYYRRCP